MKAPIILSLSYSLLSALVLGFSPPHSSRGQHSICRLHEMNHQDDSMGKWFRKVKRALVSTMIIPALLGGPSMKVDYVRADDELARYAAEGNSVGVDGTCFIKKCALETSKCGNDPNCLKGLSCLARCKGGSMCSTGCFAKYGSDNLDSLLHCSVEKNDCVHVPGKENKGWSTDSLADLPAKPVRSFDMASMQGTWYKVMGLDSRYDCFDCQRNSFDIKNKDTLRMEALFRIPRPTFPGYLQSKIVEELHSADKETSPLANMQSRGQMFGLTFWENWYVLGDSHGVQSNSRPLGISSAFAHQGQDPEAEMKLIFYTGHTLQGSYKGAFLYSRSPQMTPALMRSAQNIIRASGFDPNKFCIIRNQCFLKDADSGSSSAVDSDGKEIKTFDMATRKNQQAEAQEKDAPFWYVGQKFFRVTQAVGEELADWFEDPTILSDWLVSQQEHMVLEQPLQVSPFASLAK